MGKVIIIAEAGVNHNGDYDMAVRLIDAAAEAGADYVKFQTFKAAKLVSKKAAMADYQVANTGGESSQFDMLKKLELPEEWHYRLKDYATGKGIGFLSTGFDEGSIDFLDELGMDLFKVPSGEITNRPYLEHIASKGKPVIVSTGMADIEEVSAALDVLHSAGVPRPALTVLHCNTEYPTPMGDVNLKAMNTISATLGVPTGYSDHTVGIEVPIAAVALGAVMIEKHFTLDRTLEGPDHLASLEPDELKAMVTAIRNIETAISGSGEKAPSPSELKNRVIARKSIHVARFIPAGAVIRIDDLEMKRPGDGLSPMKLDDVVGKTARIDLQPEHKLAIEDIDG